ncbi:MAG: MucB/RseB C-terminal domain-containing protein [Betaproteobacteria bacterium]|nr:MAG: MucB/RseB C-terminal domain-containing protein [Betaproteobacteria bacterium]
MIGRVAVAVVMAGLALGQAGAEPLAQDEALKILERIATAARTLNYKGTFVYQHSEQVETSRIVHFVDTGGDEHEKLETLDGPRREIIRNNDEVLCYYPDAKVVRSQKRLAQRSFPALLPEQLNSIAQHYTVSMGRQGRVAGFDSQLVTLEPKDGMRYGHKLWAESGSGLLLKALTLNEERQVVEQFAFTQLNIGSGVSKEMITPTYQVSYPEWRLDQFAQAMISGDKADWTVSDFPPGFDKIMEMQRTKQGGRIVVTHVVYSDGMAAVSVFVESMSGRAVNEGLARQGAINIYRRTVGDKLVTVLGEAPAATVMQIANSVSFQER